MTGHKGMGSHQSTAPITETWFTPPAIIEALGGAESFDLDPASDRTRPWPTALEHLTVEDNALLREWWGRVFLNPPYSNPLIGKFMARMAAHGQGTALIFARTETESFHLHVWGAASGVLFLQGRLHFCRADGSPAPNNAGAPSVLVAYGNTDLDILAAAPIDGKLIALRLPRSVVVAGLNPTWRAELEGWFAGRTGPVALEEVYRAFAGHPKARRNQHWQAKIRQVLQRGAFERVEQGIWQRRIAA